MRKEEFLRNVRKQIHYIYDRNQIEEELSSHIQDSILELLEEGISLEEAEEIAVSQMGNPIELGKQLNKEHHPIIGYLYNISQYILFLLFFPALMMSAILISDVVKLSTPTVVEGCVETYPINIKVELPTHDIKIDNICIMEDGTYFLTYRSYTDFFYSRAGWSSYHFNIESNDGEFLNNGSYNSSGFLGNIGYKTFTYPEDDIIYLSFGNEETIVLDLKEYIHEKK